MRQLSFTAKSYVTAIIPFTLAIVIRTITLKKQLSTFKTPIPHLTKNHRHHVKNEYANANSLRELPYLINHNSGIH
ncbi:hypothetical protein ACT3TI_00515 [Psychrobacter sp. AOP22-C1-22]|uniref:hypothetical protein n=1 Tax=unclassified Psychrobacter TaxID=196806 RepID=UPI00178785DC|nr:MULTISPECIES: hypothetical protein [unclassified Psychrobacter]MBE0405383.1 hypothetical protein [Psychrobacter sp. FME6]MBE0443697.1 hypothetical protein [Psychrobacter sp. FME5]MDN5800903.1 hypothetical protein [Psychrobacter sp.]MDN5892269.1 hypothetical protein [Psychrobacter sp.]